MDWFKAHKDYDKIGEPYRLLIALYIMSPFFIGLAVLDTHPLAGMVGIVFVCLLTIQRIIYIGKGK